MKVCKTVNADIEVTVDVSVEDLITAIYEDGDSIRSIQRTFSNFYSFLRDLSDEQIAQIPPANRKIIFDKTSELLKRYSV